MCSRRLVALARVAGTDEVLHKGAVTGEVEILAETDEGLLDALTVHGGDDVAKEGHEGGAKGALGPLEEETMCPKSEDEADVLEVCCPRCAVNEDVVKEIQHKPAEERPEDVVHQRLESCRRIAQAERRKSMPRMKSKQPNVRPT